MMHFGIRIRDKVLLPKASIFGPPREPCTKGPREIRTGALKAMGKMTKADNENGQGDLLNTCRISYAIWKKPTQGQTGSQ